MARILVVDDERSMRDYLEILLRKSGFEVVACPSVPEAQKALAHDDFDLVVSDLKLGSQSGLELLSLVKERQLGVELVLITAFATTETALQAMKGGAYDYLQKPFKNEELVIICQKAIEKHQLVRENVALRSQLGKGALLGDAPSILEIRSTVDKVAPGRTTILIEGESGTGKELVARLIHDRSGRTGSFVAMNCGAMSPELIESELFGHVRGAFTGAIQASPGLFRAAEGGTLFLDEIGELPLSLQVKLLRVLQERSVRPVGGTESFAVDVRIVAATNRSLKDEVAGGRFREDLFYRLNVVALVVPPLRERRQDVLPLARHFLSRFAHEFGRPLTRFSPEAEQALFSYAFPGNVRELENLIERAVALSDVELISVEALPPSLRGPTQPLVEVSLGTAPELPSGGMDLEAYLDLLERDLLRQALVRAEGVRTEAARLLGLSFRSLRYRLAKLGVRPPDHSSPPD